MVVDLSHYNKCKNNLINLIEAEIPSHRRVIETKTTWVTKRNLTFPEYENGYDPNSYRLVAVKQMLPSNDFTNFYKEFISRKYTDSFTLFGHSFQVNIKRELTNILHLAFNLYSVEDKDRIMHIEMNFKELYYSIYYDKFDLELTMVLRNLNLVNTTLLNKDRLVVTIENYNHSRPIVKCKISDTKNSRLNILQQNPLSI
jgi:hypothetical protein